jgi:YVTN family beta-propeller protein
MRIPMKSFSLFLSFLFCFVNTIFGVIPHAYVTNLGSTSVSVIDVSADTVQQILGFNGAHVIKPTFDGKAAYVGDQSNNIYKISTIQHTVSLIGTISSHPVAMELLPNATFIYTVNDNNTASVVDLSTDTVVGELTGFNSPQDIRVTPDGAFLYVTNKGNGTISVISTADNTVVDTITGLVAPVGITFTVDGSYAYVTEPSQNSVIVIRTSDNSIYDTIYGFSKPSYVAVTPDKTLAYVTNTANDTVSIIRTSDNFIIGTISIPAPESIGIDPSGLYVYVGSSLGNVVKITSLDNSIEAVLSGFNNPSNISFTLNNAPADTVNGWQVITDPSNPYNQLTWLEPAGSPIGYRIYRDPEFTQFVTEIVGGGVLTYNDLNRVVGQSYGYYVIADFSNGFSATIGNVTVTPDRVGLPQ